MGLKVFVFVHVMKRKFFVKTIKKIRSNFINTYLFEFKIPTANGDFGKTNKQTKDLGGMEYG